MNASENCRNLIKEFEGLRLKAYRDVGNKLTIGYGSTRDVKPDMEITEEEAERRLDSDIRSAEACVQYLCCGIPLSQGQMDALTSMAFNLPFTALRDSTLIRKLNERDFAGAAEEIPKWKYATDAKTGKKVVLPGLVKRRAREQALFNS
jgi:lysozyme